MPQSQNRPVVPPSRVDHGSLQDFAQIIQKNLTDLFQASHQHKVVAKDLTSKEGSVGDIYIVDDARGSYLSWKTAEGWNGISPSDKVFNVKSFGALGDGQTDDITAILAAIAAAQAVGGGIVFLPAGTYKISSRVYVPQFITLQGAGMTTTIISAIEGGYPLDTVLIQCGELNGTLYTSTNPGSAITMRDFTADCSGMPMTLGNGTGQGIFVQCVDDFLASRVAVIASIGYGLQVAGEDHSMLRPIVEFCYFKNCGRVGGQDSIGGGNTTDSRYLFNTFDAPNGTAIDNVHVKGALWMGNKVINSTSTTGQIWSDFGMIDSIIAFNRLETGSIHAFGSYAPNPAEPPSNVLITGNWINGGDILVGSGNAVPTDTTGCTGIVITNNIINDARGAGITLEDCPGAIVSGNQINNWDTSSAGWPALYLFGGPTASVSTTKCIITGNSGKVGGTSLWYHEATVGQTNRNEVSGNYFDGGTFTLDTTSPQSSYHHNRGSSGLQAYTTPSVPASTTVVANNTSYHQVVAITTGTVSDILVNTKSTGLTNGAFLLAPQDTISITYTVAPTWKWAPVFLH